MSEIPQVNFNEIMKNALETRKLYPNGDIEAIACLACAEYQDHDDYDLLIFQVTINLVNAER